MLKVTKIQATYLATVVIMVIVAIFLSIYLFSKSAELDLPSFTVSLLSLAIALLAFMISLQTFTSIDSVNKITKMEGNILENEQYVTSFPSLIKEYKADLPKTEEAIFKELEVRFKKKSKTAVEFADHLQYFIDLIVFFPALFAASNADKKKYKKSMESLLKTIELRKKELLTINTGNMILIEETVKLIKGVMDYQRLTSEQNFDQDTRLLEVRGSMLKNSVTRTVYYNYLGLMYNKKAMNILKQELPLKGPDLLEIDQLTDMITTIDQLKGNDRELAVMFLQESKEAFEKALSHCQEDVMWQGFIYYNDARSTFFLQLLKEDDSNENWVTIMDKAVKARSKLNILITEVLKGEKPSHMQSFFLFQEELARLMKLNIQIAETKSGYRTGHQMIYKGVDLREIARQGTLQEQFYRADEFSKITQYQKQIMVYLLE